MYHDRGVDDEGKNKRREEMCKSMRIKDNQVD